jgi:hypothetical protein
MQLYSTTYKNQFRIVSGTTTINNDDSILYCNTSLGAVTINLIDIPSDYWSTQYKLYVCDYSNNAGTNNITINAPTGFTINGSSSLVLNVNGESAIVRISGNTTFITEISNSGASATPFEGTNWSFVYGNGSHTANATQLQTAYTSAKTKTPNGSPLSATNRFTIIVGSGYYSFSSNFVMDAQYIDIVSLTGNADVIFSGLGTLSVTANDVFIKGIDVTTKNLTLATNLGSFVAENCIGGDNSFGGGLASAGLFTNCTGGESAFGGGATGVASGTFVNCTGGAKSFGGFGGEANGTFTNCVGGQYAFGGGGGNSIGTFINCTGASYSFGGGGGGTASGTFTNCNGLVESFGGGSLGLCSGTFTRCIGTTSAFGGDGTASGIFEDCKGGDNSFGGGSNETSALASGTFNNCVGGADSFGGGDINGGLASGIFNFCVGQNGSFGGGDYGTASGNFFQCIGGDESFGNTTCSGDFNNCQGGSASFGKNTNGSGVLTGKLYWCRLTSGTFQSVSSGGRTIYCIDGNNTTNNQ